MKYWMMAVVLVLTTGAMLLIKNQHDGLKVRCDAEILQTIKGPENSVMLDATASLFMLGNGKGFVNLYGTLTDYESLWLVNRKIGFEWRYERNNKIYDIAIKNVEVKPEIDKAPAALMSQIYSQHFNLEMFNVGKNAIYLRGVSTPFYLCVPHKTGGRRVKGKQRGLKEGL